METLFSGNIFLRQFGHKCKLQKSSVNPIHKAIPGQSGCSKFKRVLFRLTTIFEYHPLVSENNYNQESVNEDIQNHIKNHPYTIHPFSICMFLWDVCMIYPLSFVLIYGFVALIGRNFVPQKLYDQKYKKFKFQGRHALFIIYCLIWTRRGYWDSTAKKVELKARKIIVNYLVTYFIADLFIISVIPIQLLVSRIDYHLNFTESYGLLLLACNLRLLYVFKCILNVIKLCRVPQIICQIIGLIFNSTFFMIVLMCFSFYSVKIFGPVEAFNANWWVKNFTTSGEFMAEITASLFFNVARSFSGATTSIYHESAELYWLEVFYWIICKLFLIYIVVCFMLITRKKHTGPTKNSALLSELEVYMRSKGIPPVLRHRLKTFYTFRYQGSFFRESYILGILQGQLKQDMLIDRCEKLIHNVPFFKGMPLAFLSRVMANLQEEIYLTNDLIVKHNSESNCMYFILSGEVAVITPQGTEVVHLKQGDFFGEVGLFYNVGRTASVVSTEITVLYRLERSAFTKCFGPFPDLITHIKAKAKNRYELITILKEREEML